MLIQNINHIDLTLENLESIIIPIKYIKTLVIDNIYNKIRKINNQQITSFEYCNTLVLSIQHSANIYTNLHPMQDGLPFERILYGNDITAISLNGRNIYVPWGLGEYTNEYQYTHMNKLGDIFIVISQKEKFHHYFDKSQLDNIDYINYIW